MSETKDSRETTVVAGVPVPRYIVALFGQMFLDQPENGAPVSPFFNRVRRGPR